MRLFTIGQPFGLAKLVVGRVTTKPLADQDKRLGHIFVTASAPSGWPDIKHYAGLLTTQRLTPDALRSHLGAAPLPVVHSVREIDHLRDGDVVVMQPHGGFVRTLYRPDSRFNTIFTTDRCNSNF